MNGIKYTDASTKQKKGGKSSSSQQAFSVSPFYSQTSSSTTKVCEDNGGTENVSCEEDDLLRDDKGNDISQAVKDLEVDYVFRSNSVYISLL